MQVPTAYYVANVLSETKMLLEVRYSEGGILNKDASVALVLLQHWQEVKLAVGFDL